MFIKQDQPKRIPTNSNTSSHPFSAPSLPSIPHSLKANPIKVTIDFKREYEEDQELISMLDPRTYKPEKPIMNSCEIIPEEEADILHHKHSARQNNLLSKRMLIKRHINSGNNKLNTHSLSHHPRSNHFPLLTNNSSPKRINHYMFHSQKPKHINILTQSTPLSVATLLTTPHLYDNNIESPSTSGFTHDTPDHNGNDVHFKTKPLLTNGEYKLPVATQIKPLTQQQRRYKVNLMPIYKPKRGFSSNGHDKKNINGNMNYRSVHRIKIERGMIGTKLMDKLVNTMKYDVSTGMFREEFGFGNY